MQQLLKEAFHSYQIYLQCTGVLDVHNAKLSLLLWPDIAHTAIELLETPDNPALLQLLRQDLGSCIFEPISVIHASTAERIKTVTGKCPARSDKVFVTAKELKDKQPQEAKKMLLSSINRMFVTLNTLTDIKYPVLNPKKA